MPDIFTFEECSSTFDLAWDLCAAGRLPVWGSVLARRQSGGRGQLRRPWHSPAGNLYVSFRLPDFFLAQEAAPLLTAFLLIRAFASLGLPLWLKWPNDLVLLEARSQVPGQPDPVGSTKLAGQAGWTSGAAGQAGGGGLPGKLGGLLLEERNGILLAGLGLNCAIRPGADILREDAALQPAVLPTSFSPRAPIPLWLQLVPILILLYEQLVTVAPMHELLQQSEDFLLWKGSAIEVRDHYENGSVVSGILAGLTGSGGLRLLVRPGEACASNGFVDAAPVNGSGELVELALYSGSIRPIG